MSSIAANISAQPHRQHVRQRIVRLHVVMPITPVVTLAAIIRLYTGKHIQYDISTIIIHTFFLLLYSTCNGAVTNGAISTLLIGFSLIALLRHKLA